MCHWHQKGLLVEKDNVRLMIALVAGVILITEREA